MYATFARLRIHYLRARLQVTALPHNYALFTIHYVHYVYVNIVNIRVVHARVVNILVVNVHSKCGVTGCSQVTLSDTQVYEP